MLISDGSKEKAPAKWAIIIYTLLLFSLMHVWQPFVEPLSSNESLHALTAVDILAGRGAGRLIGADGNLIDFPLHSLALAVIGSITQLTDFTCRIPQLIAILVMTLMSGYVTARAAGHRAGLTAASVMLVSFGVGFFDPTANTILAATFMFTAWTVWYRASRIWNWQWTLTWMVSLLPVAGAVLAIGFKAIIFFYLPLIFLHRPLKARKRLTQVQHFIAIAVVLTLFIWVKSYIFEGKVLMELMTNSNYSVFQFLFIVIAFCFPWILVGWPILCMAFQGVEQTPVFNQYIRTILVTVMIWSFLFSRSIENLLLIMPVFAVATGLNYNIFIRRYYLQVRYSSRTLMILNGVTAIWALALIGLVHWQVAHYANMEMHRILTAFGATVAMFLMAFLLFLLKKRFMIYSCRLAIISACFICSIIAINEATTTDFNYRKNARRLVQSVDISRPIYLLLKREAHRESYNLRHNVINIDDTESLPLDEKVYVLTDGKAPIQETREWNEVVSIKFPDGPLSLWMGQKRLALIEDEISEINE